MARRSARDQFANRADAGRRLGTELVERGVGADVVLTIPRGGLPIGRAVADALECPLDVIVAAKIGAPGNDEFAIGAVGSDGTAWLDDETIDRLGVDPEYVDRRRREVADAAAEKEARYRDASPGAPIDGATVLLVDDGAATGSTAIAATRLAYARGASRVVIGLPVAPPETVRTLEREADGVICLLEPREFRAVGQFYAEFGQVSDESAIALLDAPE